MKASLGNLLLFMMLCILATSFANIGLLDAREEGGSPMVLVKTNMGSFKIELFAKEAPITVKNFLNYVDKKFYDGTIFHRVIPGFVIQGGGSDKNMMQKTTLTPIQNEATNGLKNLRGTLSMARTPDINSATSQFFVNLKDNASLDHMSDAQYGYAVFGKVVEGMDVVDKIAAVATGSKGRYQDVPVNPIIIESMTRSGNTETPFFASKPEKTDKQSGEIAKQELRRPLASEQEKVLQQSKQISRQEPRDPAYPPSLTGSISFSEPSGNNLLDGNESAHLKLHLLNRGRGDAYSLKVEVDPEGQYSDIKCDNPKVIPHLKPGDSIDVDIPIYAGMYVDSMSVAYRITVDAENGFDMNPPLRVQFRTQRFRPPKLAVADYAIDDLNHNRKVEPSEMVTIISRIQNRGSGEALDVRAAVKHGENVFVAGDSKTEFDIGKLAPGESKDIQFSLYTNNRATAMPVTITLSEHYGKFGSTENLDLPFNVVQKQVSELVVEGKAEATRSSATAPALVADIDRNIPKGKTSNPDAIAIVIGNYRYQSGDVPPVDYALEDAATMREYLKSLLGYRERNIFYFENATKAQFEALFGTENNPNGKLNNYVKPGLSDVFIYYCGHGAPDPATSNAYFVPSDCDPSVIALNGYSLDTFYKNLAMLPAKSLSVVIDACFSGSSNSGMLVKGASPALMRVKYPLLTKQNTQLFLASQADQIASWYPEMKHGLFTYFFLKGIGGAADLNADGSITLGEMKSYLDSPTDGVPYYARRIWQRDQMPMVSSEDLNREVVRTK